MEMKGTQTASGYHTKQHYIRIVTLKHLAREQNAMLQVSPYLRAASEAQREYAHGVLMWRISPSTCVHMIEVAIVLIA